MLILYHHNISVCAQKVRIALAEKDLSWQGVHVDLMQGQHLKPEFLKVNPRGLVPVLVHDGDPIYESTIILEYLEDAFPQAPLRPTDAKARARISAHRRRAIRRQRRTNVRIAARIGLLKPLGVKVTRIAMGVPVGSDLAQPRLPA